MSGPGFPPPSPYAARTPPVRGPETTLAYLVLAIVVALGAIELYFGVLGACLMVVPPPDYYNRARAAVAALFAASVFAFGRGFFLLRPSANVTPRLGALWVAVGMGCLGVAAFTFLNIHPTMMCGVPPFQ